MPTPSIARPSKIFPNLDFWFEDKPSGNPCYAFQNIDGFSTEKCMHKNFDFSAETLS
jgi:hypothetical protein